MLYYPDRESEGKGGKEGTKGRKTGEMRGKGKGREDKWTKSNKNHRNLEKTTEAIEGDWVENYDELCLIMLSSLVLHCLDCNHTRKYKWHRQCLECNHRYGLVNCLYPGLILYLLAIILPIPR